MSERTSGEYLKKEFQRRKKLDPKFSLRAFAQMLELSPSMLSQVMSGSRKLGVQTAVKIADRCEFNDNRREEFLSLVLGVPFNSSEQQVSDREFRTLPMDEFAQICSWHHLAILSLGELRSAKFDKTWIARRLNITESEAETAMAQLVALRFIEVVGTRFKHSGRRIRTRSDVPNQFVRQFHSTLMMKAAQSLKIHSVSERDITAVVMSVNKKRLRTAKNRIKDFRRKIMKYLNEGSKDDVFALQISLFPLTTKE